MKRYKLQVLRVMDQHLAYTETQRDQYLAEIDEAILIGNKFCTLEGESDGTAHANVRRSCGIYKEI